VSTIDGELKMNKMHS